MPWLFLAVSVVGLSFTAHAFLPLSNRRRLFVASFFVSMVTIELAAHHLLWQAIAAFAFIQLGALRGIAGWVGLAISAVSWVGLLVLVQQGRRSRTRMAEALEGYAQPDPDRTVPTSRLLVPIPLRPGRTRRRDNVLYGRAGGRRLRLDVYLPRHSSERRPAVVQIHGGAWVVGDKRTQGLPLMRHLADHGWVGFNVNYRLSPGATFPDHLIDIKRAIAWIREHAEEYGVDPSFVAVTGGSAGGHLASLAALTSEDSQYQPGFEHADTSVQACIPVYAIYDFTDRLRSHGPRFRDAFIGPIVLKAFYDDEPERFEEASPLDRIHAAAPPFFVVHGDRDTMAPLADAREFVERLRQESHAPVRYAEIGGAQHSFDVLPSPRSLAVIDGMLAFLDESYRRHRESTRDEDASGPPTPGPNVDGLTKDAAASRDLDRVATH